MFGFKKVEMVSPADALPGRTDQTMPVPAAHFVNGNPLVGPWPDGMETAVFAMGCFWGAERKFWQAPGVITTAAGYAGGFTENPTYEETCTGQTGHTEVVRVVYDPQKTSTAALVKLFFESHDPTQGMRQGNDTGTVYRSALYWNTPEQHAIAVSIHSAYSDALKAKGLGPITTEMRPMSEAGPFYFAEDYHQQYLDKNPNGYCGLGGTGVACPVGLTAA